LRVFLINPKNKEKDKNQKTKNIKITAENAKYLKKCFNNYMFFEKVKSCELSSETRRTEKKIRNKKRRTSNNCRKHIKK